MTILLDTNVLVWALLAGDRIKPTYRRQVSDTRNTVYFSTICIWEIAIKFAQGRRDFRLDPQVALSAAREIGFSELTFDGEVASDVARLAPHHRDPFDRLLVAQALRLSCRLYTSDEALLAYSDLVTLVR